MTMPGDVLTRLTAALSRSYRLERELGAGGMATTGTAFSAGIPKPLLSTAGLPASVCPYDVSPDARRFLFVRFVGSAPGANADELVLVQNFASELKTKAPR